MSANETFKISDSNLSLCLVGESQINVLRGDESIGMFHGPDITQSDWEFSSDGSFLDESSLLSVVALLGKFNKGELSLSNVNTAKQD